MNWKIWCVVCVVSALLGCAGKSDAGRSGVTDSLLASKIQDQYTQDRSPITSVEIVKHLQNYADSFRSPQDTGTTYVVSAQIHLPNGKMETRNLEVFIADKDGWTSVKPAGSN